MTRGAGQRRVCPLRSARRWAAGLPALAALLASPALAQDYRGQKPEDVAAIFCIARIADDDAPIRAMLTARLAATLAEAETRNAEIAARAPDEKPPLGDGVPWASWPDAADTCTPGAPIYMMDEARIAVAYHFGASADADYADTLLLERVEGASGQKLWRIGDVAYDTGDTLSMTLVMAFMPN